MRRCEDEKVWRWEDVKMRRCEDEKVWRWEDVKMRGCEDERLWRWEGVKMRRCFTDEKVWRWEDVKMRRCEDEKVWRWEDVKMRGCEDERMWRWEGVKMRRCFTDPHYWKNPALRRSREKMELSTMDFPDFEKWMEWSIFLWGFIGIYRDLWHQLWYVKGFSINYHIILMGFSIWFWWIPSPAIQEGTTTFASSFCSQRCVNPEENMVGGV